ncbi:helix-turn-helix domain-containing protein [Clostridium sp. YIM B02506]|uniref:helix-turn-helix domain-containing protein n=1 Tax=Clostridium sp. YIM B02506 TaxID=2910680 RepID=UPI001EED30A6|nr:helix-turn-helix domain-containing protein [Clostridium sp. YIM B02506]
MDSLLTIEDLAKKWNYSKQTIMSFIEDGKLQPCKMPGKKLQFTLSYIESIENSGLADKLSPVERLRLERKILKLEEENSNKNKQIEEFKKKLKRINGELRILIEEIEIKI